MILADLLTMARKVQNYAVDATGGGQWIDTTHFRATCPSNKRWFFIGGCAYRGVAATATVIVEQVGAGHQIILADVSSAATPFAIPDSTHLFAFPPVLDAGDYLEAVFSVAQNASSSCALNVLEVDV